MTWSEVEIAPEAATEGDATWRTITLVVMGLLGAAVLVALIITLSGANRQRDRALELQSHSYDVMILARTLSGTIARSEASLGRYVISGDASLGQLYYDQWRLAGTQINRLDQLTESIGEQNKRVEQLRDVYQSRGEELSLIALSTYYHKNAQALARFYKARQSPTLSAIDDTLDQIIGRERALLDARTTFAMRTVGRASRVAGVLAVFGVLIVAGAIVLGWFTVHTIGERVAARAEATAAQERAEELAAAVAVATDELRAQDAKLRQIQKMEAVGQLTGGIAHDFNNMLAVVLGGLELARRAAGQDPRAATHHIDSATDGANRAAALTRRLLAFSREESLKPEWIAGVELVTGMSELLDRTLGETITIATRDDGCGWCVRADRVQLENAVLNLAVNARDAMNGRGTLVIETRGVTLAEHQVEHCAPGDYIAIAVTDTGSGMTPAIAERVFEPFFTTKDAGKGTGLGLSQIFALVRQLDGAIAIDTQIGRGTTVTLYLPRDAAGLATEMSPCEAVPITGLPTETLNILVVEDDPRVLAATIGALEEMGHVCVACSDPARAAGLLADHGAIDLIISDVLMPGQTGPEMIAAIGPRFPHIAVLFVTGFAGETNASDFGDHPLLRKPFTLSGLERAIGQAMARPRSAPPHQIAAE